MKVDTYPASVRKGVPVQEAPTVLPAQGPAVQLALVRLPNRIRRALQLFRRISGLIAVATVMTSVPAHGARHALLPPLHPRCARRLRSNGTPPCAEEWSIHVRESRLLRRPYTHTCPLGLRCSGVPIYLGESLVGLAKVVVDGGTPERTLKSALSVLTLVLSETCQESALTVLSDEVQALRNRVLLLQRIPKASQPPSADHQSPTDKEPGERREPPAGATLVSRAIAHLQGHYKDRDLSLRSISAVMSCNPRYLTGRFTEVVGERMHTYLTTLRVAHASRLLIRTRLRVKEIAFASGFNGSGRYRRLFAEC